MVRSTQSTFLTVHGDHVLQAVFAGAIFGFALVDSLVQQRGVADLNSHSIHKNNFRTWMNLLSVPNTMLEAFCSVISVPFRNQRTSGGGLPAASQNSVTERPVISRRFSSRFSRLISGVT